MENARKRTGTAPIAAQRAAVLVRGGGRGDGRITLERPAEITVGGDGWPRYRPQSGPACPGNESGTAEVNAPLSLEETKARLLFSAPCETQRKAGLQRGAEQLLLLYDGCCMRHLPRIVEVGQGLRV